MHRKDGMHMNQNARKPRNFTRKASVARAVLSPGLRRKLGGSSWKALLGSLGAMAPAAMALGAQDPGSIVPGTREGLTANSTTYGSTGLINVPTAYSLRRGQAVAGASFLRDRSGPYINYGVADDIEVGLSYMDRRNGDGRALANGKITFRPANFRNVEVGVGVIDAFDALNQTVYAVASVDLVPPRVQDDVLGKSMAVKVHAGYGSGLYRDKIIGGAELAFNSKFSVVGEWDGVTTNAALRYRASPNVTLQGGIVDNGPYFGITAHWKL